MQTGIRDRMKAVGAAIRAIFADKGEPARGEVGYASQSMIYGSGDFTRYNPDVLLRRKGLGIYDKMLDDDQVYALSQFLKLATIARGFHFPIDADDPDAEAQKEFVEFWDDMMEGALRGTWMDRLIEMQTAHDYGVSMIEKVMDSWDWRGKAMWALRDAKLRLWSSFQFKSDKHGNAEAVTQAAGGDKQNIDIARFIHYVNHAEKDPHYGRSDLRVCYRPWWSKNNVIKFMNIWLERMASGFTWFKEKGNVTDAARTAIENILDQMQSASGFMIPDSVDFNVSQPSTTDAFERAIAIYDKAMAKGMLVPNLLGLSEQGSVGSYAQSKVQLEAFFFTLDARSHRVADAIQEQLVRELARWNFGLDRPPKYTPLPLTQQQKIAIIEVWTKAVTSGAAKADLPSEQHLRQMLDFPARAEDGEKGPNDGSYRPPSTLEPEPDSRAGGDSIVEGNKAAPPGGEAKGSGQFAEGGWAARVNFKEMDRWSEAIIADGVEDLGGAMDAMWDGLKKKIVGQRLGTRSSDAEKIAALEIPSAQLASIRKAMVKTMRAAWKAGTEQAQAELPAQSTLSEYAARVPRPGFDLELMEEFLKARSFTSTKKVTAAVLEQVQGALYNGLKYDKTTAQVMSDLKPLIQEMIPKVDSAGRTVNKAHRLETIVRTNSWEAINESRQSVFGDPDLEGFVQAMEYTAILDDRTTEICSHLDGKVYPVDSPNWDGLRPPNHFNCRSLLIPITAVDKWKASPPPSSRILPQKGFS